MVIFGVFGEHAGKEGDFARGKGRGVGHYDLAVVPGRSRSELYDHTWTAGEVPDLEILVVLDGNRIQPFELLYEILL